MTSKKTKKVINPISNESAYAVPNWLSQIPSKLLSPGAKALYARLSRWASKNGIAFRSAKNLGLELGEHDRQIRRLIKELIEVGLIDTFQECKGGENYYQFYEHEWMAAQITTNLLYNKKTLKDINSVGQTSLTPRTNQPTPLGQMSLPHRTDSPNINNKGNKSKDKNKGSVFLIDLFGKNPDYTNDQYTKAIQTFITANPQLKISDPVGITAEIIYYIENPPEGKTRLHTFNIAMKLLVNKAWLTPSGMGRPAYTEDEEDEPETPEQRKLRYERSGGAQTIGELMKNIKKQDS